MKTIQRDRQLNKRAKDREAEKRNLIVLRVMNARIKYENYDLENKFHAQR